MQNTSHSSQALKTFENLYPAILECFLIILLGYVAGRTRLVAPSQARGLGNYVTYFALPALIFKSMVEVEFAKVNWLFWSAILVSKAIVFVIVYVFSLVLGRDFNIGRAGIFAVFATQSNDFALGYPIGKNCLRLLYFIVQINWARYKCCFSAVHIVVAVWNCVWVGVLHAAVAHVTLYALPSSFALVIMRALHDTVSTMYQIMHNCIAIISSNVMHRL